jgi:hypothetical protein
MSVAYNYPYSQPSATEFNASVGDALADPNTVFAKNRALKKRSAPSMLGDILTPEDFGAPGDGTSHPLSESYANLTAARVDYPAATALTDEKDWCALKYMFETSGIRRGQGDGKYYVNNSDLAHVIRWKAGAVFTWGVSSQVIFTTFGYPVFAAIEQSDVTVEGLNLLAIGTMSTAFNSISVFTVAQFNSTVGAININIGDRNLHACVVLAGAHRFKGRNWTIQHQSPGIGKPSNEIGIYMHLPLAGGQTIEPELSNMRLDDMGFGILLEATQFIKMHNITSKRRNQLFVDYWAAGHVVYFAQVSGSLNFQPDVDGIYDGGFLIMTDSYPITVSTGADTVTLDTTALPISVSMATGTGVIFQDDLPPAPLIRSKQYYAVNYSTGASNTAPYVFQVANTVGGAAIDLTAAPGANCRVSLANPLYTINCRYMRQGSVSHVKSACPYGVISIHSHDGTTIEDIQLDCQIFSGVLTAATATGGTFDTGVNDRLGAVQGKRIRMLSGAANGYEGEVLTQTTGRAFIVSPAWPVTPSIGDSYEVGSRYAANSQPVHSPGTGDFSMEHVRINGMQILGEFAQYGAILQDVTLVSTTPQARDVRFRDIDIEIDISRITALSIIQLRSQQVSYTGTMRLLGSWPSGEKGFITPSQGTTGWADIMLEDPATYSRIVNAANNDFIIKLRSKTGKPIPFISQWANEAVLPGFRVQSDPLEQMFIAAGGTGTPTITLTNFGQLKDKGLYYLTGLFHDTGWTQVCFVDWLINYGNAGTPTITKLNTRPLIGATITAADVTQTGGVLSGTVTTASSLAVVVSWTNKLLNAHP